MTASPPRMDIAELYRRYGGMILRRIRRFYSAEQAEDVLQEVFLRAIDKLDTFRGESSPATWLYQLTTNHCINRLRNEGRRRELWLEQSDDVYWSQPVSRAEQERKALLSQLWKNLDEEMVMIGVYYYLDGMTHDEIARVVGCSRRTVGNRLLKLQELAQGGEGGGS